MPSKRARALASPGDTSLGRLRAVARPCELNADLPSSLAIAKPSASARVWAALAVASAPPDTPAANWRWRNA
eukprot:2995221-Alexandrium_andersonii.AAC.1